jgi:hypothetical protein
MTPLNPFQNAPSAQAFVKELRPAPPVYRPNAAKVQPKMAAPQASEPSNLRTAPPAYRPHDARVQPKMSAPPVYRPSTIQLYKAKSNGEKREILGLRNRYVIANNDDESYYGPKFDEQVGDADSMSAITAFVVKAETAKAKKASVKLPSPQVTTVSSPPEQLPPQIPVLSEPKQKALTKQQKKKKEKIYLTLSDPEPPKANWGAMPSSIASQQPLPLSTGPSPLIPPLVHQGENVDTLIQQAASWDGHSDKGKKVQLTPQKAVQLMDGLGAITTQSGSNQRFYVGFSEGETKYNGHVCIKAIAGYSQQVSQATTHHPTYHFEVKNLSQLTDSRKLT